MKNDIDINKLEMREVYLTCPVKSEDLVPLKLGDQVYLSGVIFTGREGLYQRLIEQNLELPVPVTEISNVNFNVHLPPRPMRKDMSSKQSQPRPHFVLENGWRHFLKRPPVKSLLEKQA